MNDKTKKFWEDRYSEREYVYGEQPNVFLQNELMKLEPASILLPADGEGRNAVFAAKQGWDVTAFDLSTMAKIKALSLAQKNKVDISFEVSSVLNFQSDRKFDVIALIYAHFDVDIRIKSHQHLINLLKPGGVLIFEAFSKKQLSYNSGGPKDLKMLFSIEEMKSEFSGLTIQYLEELGINQKEGKYHQGKSSVIRMVAKKI